MVIPPPPQRKYSHGAAQSKPLKPGLPSWPRIVLHDLQLLQHLQQLRQRLRHNWLFALFFVLPTLVFRFSFFIITHNSVSLSMFSAVVFVYVPVKLVVGVLQTVVIPAYAPKRVVSFSTLSEKPIISNNAVAYRPTRLRSIFCVAAAVLYIYIIYEHGLRSPYATAVGRKDVNDAVARAKDAGAAYFIAANFYNNEDILPVWIAEIVKLVDILGEDNVYLSLSENDSDDATASRLLQFKRYLTHRGVAHNLNVTSGLRPFPRHDPWVDTQMRVEYMTMVRNIALEPLYHVSSTSLGRRVTRIIFLNDVIYHHTDVLKLIYDLHPRPGDELTPTVMACGFDMQAATLYDQWAARDRHGNGLNGMYPFFTDIEDQEVVKAGGVVEVGACWNGIAVMDAAPFLSPPRSYDFRLLAKPQSRNIDRRGFEDISSLSSSLSDSQTTVSSDSSQFDEGHYNSHTTLVRPLRFPPPPRTCAISECTLLPLALMNSYIITTSDVIPRIVMDMSVVVAYEFKWWWFYAHFMRAPVVHAWDVLFERRVSGVWRAFGFDNLYAWEELNDGCIVEPWPAKFQTALPVVESTAASSRPRIRLSSPNSPKLLMEKAKRKIARQREMVRRGNEDLIEEREHFLSGSWMA
ncbi:cryptococcal mannosyltransferase 1-domain-containing protein [Limtongia smithiae]|uniref:cryptococcal mannosyltransferase 1-domain-containing protein n=1 Tax=Limtongia smithiae TaxID=1125753 RepID=UPI0034CD0E1C